MSISILQVIRLNSICGFAILSDQIVPNIWILVLDKTSDPFRIGVLLLIARLAIFANYLRQSI